MGLGRGTRNLRTWDSEFEDVGLGTRGRGTRGRGTRGRGTRGRGTR